MQTTAARIRALVDDVKESSSCSFFGAMLETEYFPVLVKDNFACRK